MVKLLELLLIDGAVKSDYVKQYESIFLQIDTQRTPNYDLY